jgi:outer membrane autotransporter protein
VSGDVTFDAGSIYRVALNPQTASLTQASGTATINGGQVQVLAGAGSYAPAYTYTILTAAGGRSGAFDGVTTNLAFLTPTLSDDANNVYLTMTRNDIGFGDIGGTPNQRATGTGVDLLNRGNPIWDATVQLDIDTARNAFDQLSGEIHSSMRGALIEDSRFVREAALARAACGLYGSDATTVARSSDGRPVEQNCAGEQRVIWARGFGSWGHTNSDGNAARLNRSIGGVFTGVDVPLSDDLRVGGLAGYSRGRFDGDRGVGDSTDGHVAAHVGGQWGALTARAGMAYAWHDLHTLRSIGFSGFADRLTADYRAGTAQAFGELGYRFTAQAMLSEPFIDLTHVNVHANGFTEQGGEAALTMQAQRTAMTFSTLGLREQTSFGVAGLKATVMLGWRHAFGAVTPRSAMAFASDGDTFLIAGVPIARNAALIDAGLEYAFSRQGSLGISYSGQYGSGLTDSGVRATFHLRF